MKEKGMGFSFLGETGSGETRGWVGGRDQIIYGFVGFYLVIGYEFGFCMLRICIELLQVIGYLFKVVEKF